MLINKAIKIRLYPTLEQEIYFQKNFDACRFVHNYWLTEKTQNYLNFKDDKEKLYSFKYRTEKDLKIEFPFLKEADSVALQQEGRDLIEAFKNYFRKMKEGKLTKLTEKDLVRLSKKSFTSEIAKFIAYHPDYPRFKIKKENHNSYRTFIGSNKGRPSIKNKTQKIKLAKIGWIKFRHSNEILENIKSVTISKNPSGEYYCSCLYEDEISDFSEQEINETECLGLDMNAASLAVPHNSENCFSNEKFYRRNERRLKIRQRKLSKKKLDSKNREKQRIIVAKIHQKIANQKDAYLHNLTKYLSEKYKAIFIENINSEVMKKWNSGFSKTISHDLSWSKFIIILNYKMLWKGRYLIKVDRRFPSSKMCSNCGQINNELQLNQRTWKCACGAEHNRDKNAALNIFREGINLLKNSTVVSIESYALGSMSYEVQPGNCLV